MFRDMYFRTRLEMGQPRRWRRKYWTRVRRTRRSCRGDQYSLTIPTLFHLFSFEQMTRTTKKVVVESAH